MQILMFMVQLFKLVYRSRSCLQIFRRVYRSRPWLISKVLKVNSFLLITVLFQNIGRKMDLSLLNVKSE